MRAPTLTQIATAIARVDRLAGARCDEPNSVKVRAKRMIDCGYITAGDPYEWSNSGGAVATILMECKGGAGDCEPPFDYWGEYRKGGVDAACEASNRLKRHYIEFVNAAVALVYPC